MKVIDLLNKIANGEEVPKKIHYNCVPLYWCEPCKIYETMTDDELCGKDLYTLLDNLNDEVEILEEEDELHANNIEFIINNDKRDFIITLDKNDLGIDKLHLDNCYFYKENDKWYVKKYDFISIEEEKKIPEKLDIRQEKNIKNNWKWKVYGKEHSYNISTPQKIIADKVNEICDYLKSKGDE